MNKKEITEMINDLKDQMSQIVDTATAENRLLTDDENKQFASLEAQAKNAEATLANMEKIENMQRVHIATPMSQEEKDVKDFADFIRHGVTQEGSNITKGDNGAIIPETIARRVIDKVIDISPVFARAHRYNVKGTLDLPYIADGDNDIAMAFHDEFVDLESTALKISSIQLTGYLAGVFTKISKSLLNNTDIALANIVVDEMARAVALFYEDNIFHGHTPAGASAMTVEGITQATQVIETAAASAFTADELITLVDTLKTPFQKNACFIMAPATLTAIRKMKYTTGEYLVNPDFRTGFGTTILGKPVFVSDQMDAATAGNKCIVYADFGEALAVKMVEEFQLQALKEKFALQHAVGYVGWTEFDAKIQNQQAIAVLKMKNS